MGFTVISGDTFGIVGYSDNFSFDGTQREGVLNFDGQLWIGATAFPHVRRGMITSPTGSVLVGYSAPNITLDVTMLALTINTDFGSATPINGEINLFGTNGINTSGIANTVTIDFTLTDVPQIPTTFTADTGTATPENNNLNVLGGTDIHTQGIGDTLLISFTGTPIMLDFVTDFGTATPAGGEINILGDGMQISTTGTGNTVTIHSTGGGSGSIIQQTRTHRSDVVNVTNSMPSPSNNIPQIDQGIEIFSVDFTPFDSNNIIILELNLCIGGSSQTTKLTMALFQDAISDAIYAKAGFASTGSGGEITMLHFVPNESTTTRTYSIRAGGAGNSTVNVNGKENGGIFGGVNWSTFIINEVVA